MRGSFAQESRPVAISMPQSCRDWPLKTAIRQAMAITTANTEELGNAYVSAMWGDKEEHVVLAMALGQSLSETGTRLPRILLHTYDVPLCHCQALRRWWTLKEVPYIK